MPIASNYLHRNRLFAKGIGSAGLALRVTFGREPSRETLMALTAAYAAETESKMLNPMRSVFLITTVAMIGATAQPLAAETVADCYEKVLKMCDEALQASRWYEKPLIGVVCTGMLLGCNTTVTVSK